VGILDARVNPQARRLRLHETIIFNKPFNNQSFPIVFANSNLPPSRHFPLDGTRTNVLLYLPKPYCGAGLLKEGRWGVGTSPHSYLSRKGREDLGEGTACRAPIIATKRRGDCRVVLLWEGLLAMTHKGDRQVALTIVGHKNLCPYKDQSSRRGREDLSANPHCPRFWYAADFDY